MTADDRKKLAGSLREALSLALQRGTSVHLSQFHAGLLLELLNESDQPQGAQQ